MNNTETIEELKMADWTLDGDGYKSWSYVRLAIAKAITKLQQNFCKPDVIRWVECAKQMPDYDGMYLAFIHQKQVCGTVLKIQRVVENRMDAWVLDESDEVKFWAKLPPPPVV